MQHVGSPRLALSSLLRKVLFDYKLQKLCGIGRPRLRGDVHVAPRPIAETQTVRRKPTISPSNHRTRQATFTSLPR